MVLLSLVLNAYWFFLMVKMIVRLLERMNQTEEEKLEVVELVKADAMKEDDEVGDKSTQGSVLGDIIQEEVFDGDQPNNKLEVLGLEI
jgi:hypothetical protein